MTRIIVGDAELGLTSRARRLIVQFSRRCRRRRQTAVIVTYNALRRTHARTPPIERI